MTRPVPMPWRSLITLVFLAWIPIGAAAQAYFPGQYPDWERRAPAELGLDADLIQEAVEIAIAGETQAPRDLELNHQRGFGREPYGDAVGPFTVRAPQTGLIVYKGYIVAEWGDPYKVDNTFSVSKSFLSTTVGLAYDQGIIRDVHDPVRNYMAPIVLDHGDGEPGDEDGRRAKLLFESEHNRKVTWDHLLRQTSDWEGTLWGKPEWADRPSRNPDEWGTRPRREPGTSYEYNDTRVNLLALAAMSVWRRPLPEVLREHVMDPIGASPTWRWHGYDNSWVTVDGQRMQAVSGGAHWGGGMLLNAFDQARFGLLTMHKGLWDGERIISEEWIDMSTSPDDVNTTYGYMNYALNAGGQRYAEAPEYTWTHVGAGSNLVYVDPSNELVIVSRWIRGGAFTEVVHTVLDAIRVVAAAN